MCKPSDVLVIESKHRLAVCVDEVRNCLVNLFIYVRNVLIGFRRCLADLFIYMSDWCCV